MTQKRTTRDHKFFMTEALKEAAKAFEKGEVPVGAVIVKDGEIIARGHNNKETTGDPTAHAEVVAVKKAANKLKNWRLEHTLIYVTLEPCVMCMGALVQARVPEMVFSSMDPKAGACGSLFDLSDDLRMNHRIKVQNGIMKDESSALLKDFFSKLRK